MSLYNIVSTVSSKKNGVDVNRVIRAKMYYFSLYQDICNRLYDAGYTADMLLPTEEELLATAYDLKVIPKELSGALSKDSRYLKLFLKLKKGKVSKEAYDFLSMYVHLHVYREMVEDIDNLYEKAKMLGRKKLQVSIKYSERRPEIICRSGFRVSEATMLAILPPGVVAEKRTVNGGTLSAILETLGWEKEYNSHDESAFVKGLTKEEELEFLDLILSGRVDLDGRMVETVEAWTDGQNVEGEMLNGRIGLLPLFTAGNYNTLTEKTSLPITDDVRDGVEVLGFSGTDYFVKGTPSEMTFKQPIALYSCDWDAGTSFAENGLESSLRGLSGEYTRGVYGGDEARICPVVVITPEGKEERLYPLKQVTSWAEPVLHQLGASLDFGGADLPESPFNENSLEDRLFKGYFSAQERGHTRVTLSYEEFEQGIPEVMQEVVKALKGAGA